MATDNGAAWLGPHRSQLLLFPSRIQRALPPASSTKINLLAPAEEANPVPKMCAPQGPGALAPHRPPYLLANNAASLKGPALVSNRSSAPPRGGSQLRRHRCRSPRGLRPLGEEQAADRGPARVSARTEGGERSWAEIEPRKTSLHRCLDLWIYGWMDGCVCPRALC